MKLVNVRRAAELEERYWRTLRLAQAVEGGGGFDIKLQHLGTTFAIDSDNALLRDEVREAIHGAVLRVLSTIVRQLRELGVEIEEPAGD